MWGLSAETNETGVFASATKTSLASVAALVRCGPDFRTVTDDYLLHLRSHAHPFIRVRVSLSADALDGIIDLRSRSRYDSSIVMTRSMSITVPNTVSIDLVLVVLLVIAGAVYIF